MKTHFQRARNVARHTTNFLGGADVPPVTKMRGLWVIGALIIVASFIIDSTAFWVVGITVLASICLAGWIQFDGWECPGPRRVYDSPSGELSLGICHGCESWIVILRGEPRSSGQSAKALVKFLREDAHRLTGSLPVAAAEMVKAADRIEEQGELRTDHDIGGGNPDLIVAPDDSDEPPAFIKAIMDAAAEEAEAGATPEDVDLAKIMARVAEQQGEDGFDGVIAVSAKDYSEFVAWREERESADAA